MSEETKENITFITLEEAFELLAKEEEVDYGTGYLEGILEMDLELRI